MAYGSISPLHGRSAFARSASTLSLILFSFIALAPAWGQEAKQPEYQGGGGGKVRPAVKVPFKPGPFGPDGKVYAVVPDAKARRFPNEVETPQEREAEMRAFAGASIATNKSKARALTSEQLSLLNWNPSVLDAVQNPILGSLFKGEIKNPLQEPKGFKSASVPVKGKDFSGFGDTGYFPPDGGIAAGPYHVVEVVNSSVNVYDKNGNLLSSQSLNNFFSGLGTPGSDFLYDPSIYYDQAESRFWMVAVSEHDSPNRSNILVAVTADSSVSDGWYQYALDATVDGGGSTGNWCDYPHFGLDADAIYLSCNQFSFPSSASSFQYAKVRIITKTQLMTGSCCSWWDYWNLKEGFLNLYTSFTVRPALERWVGFGAGDFWVDAEGSGGSGDTLKVWQLTNATKCCDGSGGPTLNGNEQGVGSYDSAPGAAQPNAVHALDTGGTRILYATYQFGHLSVGQTISCSDGGTHACLAFTEMDVSGYPSMSNVNDWAFSQTGEDLYYPYVDQNANSDKTMVYTRSDGSSVYPGAYYRGIPRSTSCTACLGGEGTMASGQANYSVIDGSGRNRWGDYQGASNDSDFLGIWVEGEYVSSSNNWHKVIVPTYNSYGPIDSPSPTSVAFGNQAIYSSAATQYVFFQNTGNATMYTSSTQVTGDSDFYITYDGCRGVTLLKGNGCYEGVSFYPTSIGGGTGYVIVYDNTPSTYAYSTLTGTGVKAGSVSYISSSLNPSTYHQSVTFTAQVVASTSGTPGGSVTFYNGAVALGSVTLSGGLAHLTTANLGGGAHTISASYGGSPKYLTSSASLTQQVNVAPTATKVVSSKNPTSYGQSVTFTATVSSGAGTPVHGGMTFKDGAITIGTVEVANGVAAFTTSALSHGTHSITATYQGSLIFSKSTSPALSEVVNRAVTTSTVTTSVTPSSWHQTVTFTAKVTSGGGIPTGTVTFKDGTTALGAGTLNGSGIATLAKNSLAVGTHSITATYNPDTNFATSKSAAKTQTVNKASTKTALVSSKNPSTHGTAVTFTATITPAFGGTATGHVSFKNGTVVMGTGTIAGNKATFTISTLGTGSHSITAVYSGDTHLKVSTSPSVTQVVN